MDINSEPTVDDDCLAEVETSAEQTAESNTDESFYYHQDANYNVVAVTDMDGEVVCRIDYSAYGRPRFYDPEGWPQPFPDFGPAGNTCHTSAIAWQGLPNDLETGHTYNRARTLHHRLGRFGQRDLVGTANSINIKVFPGLQYIDGYNVYQYAKSCPIVYLDWIGYQASGESQPGRANPTTRSKPRDAGQCCSDAWNEGCDEGSLGGVICCDGKMVACTWFDYDPNNKAWAFPVENIVIKCVTEHEKAHFPHSLNCICEPATYRAFSRNWAAETDEEHKKDECEAIQAEAKCVKDLLDKDICSNAPNPKYCNELLLWYIRAIRDHYNKNDCGGMK